MNKADEMKKKKQANAGSGSAGSAASTMLNDDTQSNGRNPDTVLSKHINLMLTQGLFDDITELGKAMNLSRNEVINRAITQYIQANQKYIDYAREEAKRRAELLGE